MNVVITGAAGFLGSRLADLLLGDESPLPVASLLLADRAPPPLRADPRARVLAADLAAPGAAAELVSARTDVVFHLAAVVSGEAEADFDLGMRVNLDGTRALLEAVRRAAPAARFVFASTVAAFGGEPPPAVAAEDAAPTPRTSYGAAKAVGELLVGEYARRGFADARAVRLPTVSVRAGSSNAAVTSYASAVVREALAGREARCPVAPAQALWLCSPRVAVANLAHAALVPSAALGAARAVSLPGLRVSAAEMVSAIAAVGGPSAAALVRFAVDERVASTVATLPPAFAADRALRLGFAADASFEDVVREYAAEAGRSPS